MFMLYLLHIYVHASSLVTTVVLKLPCCLFAFYERNLKKTLNTFQSLTTLIFTILRCSEEVALLSLQYGSYNVECVKYRECKRQTGFLRLP